MSTVAAVVDTDFSTLVASAEQGDRAAADALFAALYEELRAFYQQDPASWAPR